MSSLTDQDVDAKMVLLRKLRDEHQMPFTHIVIDYDPEQRKWNYSMSGYARSAGGNAFDLMDAFEDLAKDFYRVQDSDKAEALLRQVRNALGDSEADDE